MRTMKNGVARRAPQIIVYIKTAFACRIAHGKITGTSSSQLPQLELGKTLRDLRLGGFHLGWWDIIVLSESVRHLGARLGLKDDVERNVVRQGSWTSACF